MKYYFGTVFAIIIATDLLLPRHTLHTHMEEAMVEKGWAPHPVFFYPPKQIKRLTTIGIRRTTR